MMVEPRAAHHAIDTLAIRAEVGEVAKAAAWLAQLGAAAKIPPEPLSRLDHCLDEALANVIMHGGPGARRTPLELQLELSATADERAAALTLSDGGLPFDPLGVKPKARPTSLDEAEPGGLGLLMMRSNADRLSYRYREERNQLTLVVCWPEVD